MTSATDQRRFPRLEVHARCRVASLSLPALDGTTENMSRSGALIRLKTDRPEDIPAIGAPVRVEIDMPANGLFGQKCLHCRGMIVRTYFSRSELPQVAVDIVQIEFRRPKPVVVEMRPRPAVVGPDKRGVQ